jgi:diphthine synthase
MLSFIGLGLHDEKDLTLKALEEARSCDVLFAEFYTSKLAGTTLDRLEGMVGKKIRVLEREQVENSDMILKKSEEKKVGFLVPGDPLISTTHIALRLEARQRGVDTKVIHNASIHSAGPAISGLFNYKFGRSASIPFPKQDYAPESFYNVIKENTARGLHTLLFLDISERLMTVNEALSILLDIEKRRKENVLRSDSLVVGIGCVGSENPVMIAGSADVVKNRDFGPDPHILIIPGELHFMEEEYLKEFGGL